MAIGGGSTVPGTFSETVPVIAASDMAANAAVHYFPTPKEVYIKPPPDKIEVLTTPEGVLERELAWSRSRSKGLRNPTPTPSG